MLFSWRHGKVDGDQHSEGTSEKLSNEIQSTRK